jgi:heat shock protein HslJ
VRRNVVVAVAVGIGLLAGCGDDGEEEVVSGEPPGSEPSGSGGELAGRVFLSSSLTEGGEDKALVAGTQVQVTFHEDGRLTVNGGCNTLGATPTITADRIEVGDGMSMTEMGCEPHLMAQDQWLADLFQAAPTYVLEGDTLRLTGGDQELVLVDREVADPDRALEGTVWALDGMIEGDAVGSVPAGGAATLTFEGGTVAVDGTGCNGGSGAYTVDGAELTVGPLLWTRMACGEPTTTIEAALTAVLDGTIAYEIEAGTLTLSHPGGRGLTLRAG